MQKIRISVDNAFDQLLGAVGLSPASVGYQGGRHTPVIDVRLLNNLYDVDFAAIKRALRDDHVILCLSSPDGRESLEFLLHESDVGVHVIRPNDTVSIPHVVKPEAT
jgi:hypothetical protein